tara:strand:+ start:199 stop:534 length:336 start_codon:yes stop_codon:yes gene_type:complete
MDNTIKEDMMTPIVIDLTQKNELDESWLRMFGENIKGILKAIFGNVSIPMQVKGSQSDVRSFVRALHGEKKFISTLKRYGLDNPRTYRSRASLNQATSAFERQTGIKWPFK